VAAAQGTKPPGFISLYRGGAGACIVTAAVAGDPRGHGLPGLFHNTGFGGCGVHGSSVGWEKTRQIQAAKNRRKKRLRFSRILRE
jgi:hypothetical protein